MLLFNIVSYENGNWTQHYVHSKDADSAWDAFYRYLHEQALAPSGDAGKAPPQHAYIDENGYDAGLSITEPPLVGPMNHGQAMHIISEWNRTGARVQILDDALWWAIRSNYEPEAMRDRALKETLEWLETKGLVGGQPKTDAQMAARVRAALMK